MGLLTVLAPHPLPSSCLLSRELLHSSFCKARSSSLFKLQHAHRTVLWGDETVHKHALGKDSLELPCRHVRGGTYRAGCCLLRSITKRMPGSLWEAQALFSLSTVSKKCPNPVLSQLKIPHAATFKRYCFPAQVLEMDWLCCRFDVPAAAVPDGVPSCSRDWDGNDAQSSPLED